MAAIFINNTKSDLFHSGGTANPIYIPKIEDLVSENSMLALYTQVSTVLNETIQYFLTFDDVIKVIHFGKGLGTITAEGIMYSDCDGELPGFDAFKQAISDLRGEVVEAVIGPMTLTVIMTSAQVTLVPDPITMGHFTFSFSIVNHDLG
jgi:hypothetical protein